MGELVHSQNFNCGRYTPDVGIVPKESSVLCGVCGEVMNEFRNHLGPRGFAQAMSGGKSLHDLFECPNLNEKWHKQIVELRKEAEKTSSAVLERIYTEEAQLILETRKTTK